MKQHLFALLSLILMISAPPAAAAVAGDPAPAFTATDSRGKSVSLSDYKGRTVVLEWSNNECPFVRKHYESGNMQTLQKQAAKDGVVWLTILSSAPGKQGHVDGATADKLTESRGAAPAAVLLDAAGDIGKLYQAKSTPHMFVIDPQGVLAYQGAIDSIPSTDKDDVPKAANYVTAALEAVKAGQRVATASTTAYGCGIKY